MGEDRGDRELLEFSAGLRDATTFDSSNIRHGFFFLVAVELTLKR
jgi:hypothetical protein